MTRTIIRPGAAWLASLLLAGACAAPSKTAVTPAPVAEPAPAAPPEPAPAPVAAAPAPTPPAEPAPPELKFPEDDFRKQQPAAGPVHDAKLPTPQRFKLKNGVEVYLVEQHKLPTVTMTLSFEGGSINDPAGKEGLARICTATMSDSTESLDTVAFAEAQADMASSVSVSSSDDQQAVNMSTLTRNLDATAALWAELLLKPGLRQSDFDRNVQRSRAGLKQQKGSPTGVAGLLFGSILYGEQHPLGRFISEASLGAITLDDCKAYAKDWFKPQGAKLWVAGDISRPQIEALANRLFKDWKGKPVATAKLGKPAPRPGKIFFVDVPGAQQSAVYVAHFGPPRKAKDYFASSIVGAVLGGSFSGRINMNIREKHGYAYGARGNFAYTRDYGTFIASASVRSDATDKSIVEIYNEVAKITGGDITDEELVREKNAAIFSLPARFETSGGTLNAFRQLVYFGLPLDYYNRYVKNVQAVDKKAAAAAAKKNLKPKELVVFVVGDASVVLPGLQKLHTDKTVGEGDLVILDVDGKVVGNR